MFTYQKYKQTENEKKETLTSDPSLGMRDSEAEDKSHLLFAICNDDSFSNSSLLMKDIDIAVRRMNAFSANDDLRSVLIRESTRLDSERLRNRNTGQISAVPRITSSN